MRQPGDWSNWALEQLKAVATESRREGMRRYFTTSMHCLGASVPQVRKIARELNRALKDSGRGLVLEAVRELLASGALEARHLGFEILARHEESMGTISVPELEELGAGNDNWASVDTFATQITGVLWLRNRLEDRVPLGWTESANVWWRRTAVVSTVPLNLKVRGASGDLRRTLMIVERVKAERNPMVAKAVSWALRSLVAWDPQPVREFVDAKSGLLPALVKREVGRKLETGVKNRRIRRPMGGEGEFDTGNR